MEECGEVVNAADRNAKREELADLLEVMYAIAEVFDLLPEEIETARHAKCAINGAFKQKLLLIGTEEHLSEE